MKAYSPQPSSLAEIYGADFYDSFEKETRDSARLIVPEVLQILSPQSVVDVGCGRGIWLRVFQDHGMKIVRGIDGDHVDRDRLHISQSTFTSTDLSQPFSIEGDYDLALCLEVAEHLPESASVGLVQALTRVAPCVLFSAAIPGQGGQNHINEQWPEYWHQLFHSAGFEPFDCFRPNMYQNKSVCWWYRQNLVLYVSSNHLHNYSRLSGAPAGASACNLEWVSVHVYRESLNLTLRRVIPALPSLIWRSVRNRLRTLLHV